MTVIEIKGVNGQVRFDGEHVTITRKGFMAFATQGMTGEKSIHVDSVSAIQLKRAGFFTNGYIQFDFRGSQDAKGGLLAAVNDKNTVMYKTSQQGDFDKLRDAVQSRMSQRNKSFAGATLVSEADELEKLASLRDRGVLTNDEFEAKKRQMLGLS